MKKRKYSRARLRNESKQYNCWKQMQLNRRAGGGAEAIPNACLYVFQDQMTLETFNKVNVT